MAIISSEPDDFPEVSRFEEHVLSQAYLVTYRYTWSVIRFFGPELGWVVWTLNYGNPGIIISPGSPKMYSSRTNASDPKNKLATATIQVEKVEEL